jgi:pimeloyl-ACP methyl ester carboxylesterase
MFRPLVAALPASIKPIVVDYPGNEPLDYDQLLPRIMNILPKSEPFMILGESFSGPLAVFAATQRPTGLAGVILCATFVTAPRRFIGPAVPYLSRPAIYHLYPFFQRLKARLGGYGTPELLELLAGTHHVVQPHVIAARVRTVFAVDAAAALKSIDLPMLYIQAAKDGVVPSRNVRVVQQIKPAIKIATIDTTHMVLQRKPADSAAAILEFAQSLSY